MTEPRTISGTLSADARFTLMAGACRATSLDVVLAGRGPFTVFAPTDEAFLRMPTAQFATIMPDIRGNLSRILRYHVLPGRFTAADLSGQQNVQTLLGVPVMVEPAQSEFRYGGAKPVVCDVVCSNGIIHGIDTVIIVR